MGSSEEGVSHMDSTRMRSLALQDVTLIGEKAATSTRIPPSLLRSAKSPHRAKGNQVLLCFSWKS